MESYTLYGGKTILLFDPVKHIYSVNGEIVYGVTSIKDVINKPQLMYWAVNMAAEFLQRELKPGVSYDEIQVKELIDGAKMAHRRKTQNAADIGTLAHEWISDYVYALATKGKIPQLPVNQEAQKSIKAFIDWAKETSVQITSSERKLFSIEHKYAGTLDAECVIDGKRYILDFKTSSGIYPEYALQVAAYMIAREEESGEKYDGGIIVRIDKATGAFETMTYSRDELLDCFGVFKACLVIYQWQQNLKDKKK